MHAVRTMGIDHLVWCVHGLDEPSRLFEAMGFTLTPRATHPWGTANRLVPLDGSFIELLEVADPGRIPPHQPHDFSFGAFARDFASRREGIAMVALQTENAMDSRDQFGERRLSDYLAFEFGRDATLSDGTRKRLTFRLAFVTHIEMPELAWFACEQDDPAQFWAAVGRQHANGGASLVEIVVMAPAPSLLLMFFRRLWYGTAELLTAGDGLEVQTALGRVVIATPATLAQRWPDCIWRNPPSGGTVVGMRLQVANLDRAAEGLAGRWPVEQLDDGALLIRPQDAFNVAIELEAAPLGGTVDQQAEPLGVDFEAVEPSVTVPVSSVERRRSRRR